MRAFGPLMSNATPDDLIRQAEIEGVRPEYLALMLDAAAMREEWGDFLDNETPEKVEERDVSGLRIARGHNISTVDACDEAIAEYTGFFDDVVSTVEEFGGRFPCADPRDILSIVREVFEHADDWKAALVEIRAECNTPGDAGDAIAYILSVIPDNIGE